MRRFYRYNVEIDTTTVTDQNGLSLHETLDQYLTTGKLDVSENSESYDFNSADEVDFNKDVPQDYDLYDAASGQVDPYLHLAPNNDTQVADSVNTSSDTVSSPTVE